MYGDFFMKNDKETSLWLSAVNMNFAEDTPFILALDDDIIEEETKEIDEIEGCLIS